MAIRPFTRCLVTARVSKHMMFSFQPTSRVLNEKIVAAALDDYFSMAVLQSRTHESWTWALSSTLKTDLQYTPSRCFETFPFPRPTAPQRAAAAGEALDAQRTLCMRRFGEGMTKVWNRLLDPDETDAEIVKRRQAAAVLLVARAARVRREVRAKPVAALGACRRGDPVVAEERVADAERATVLAREPGDRCAEGARSVGCDRRRHATLGARGVARVLRRRGDRILPQDRARHDERKRAHPCGSVGSS
jgi:hypothetical protein